MQKELHVSLLTLKRYADLGYDEWYALAEFVDNSLHSFMNNRNELKKLGINFCDVRLSFSENGGEINIHDNAGGIHFDDFDRLLSIGVPKEKAETQLSEFGMGMKTAAIWLGNLIEIETKHYLSDKCYKIVIDIDKLDQEDEVVITEVKSSSNLRCYTKLKISRLNRKIGRKKPKIKESLASIYRKFIENNQIKITFEDEILEPFSIELRKDAEGKPFRVDFEIILASKKKCKGWLGIMTKGKTIHSGFSVYRHNRLIQGYPENSWRPKEVFGSEGGSNTKKNQRMIGELDMTEFNVAHTKNKINFTGDDEYEFRKKLGEYCANIAREANNYKVRSVKEYKSVANVQIGQEAVAEFFKEPKNVDTSSLQYIAPTIKNNTKKIVKEIYEKEVPTIDLSHYKVIEGIEKEIYLYDFMDPKQPHLIMDEIEEKVIICINISHPFYSQILENGTTENIRDFQTNCIFDALSELHNIKSYGKYSPEDIRLTKNLYLRKYVEHISNY